MEAQPGLVRVWAEDVAEVVSRRSAWDELAGARVVVTGAGGFLGGYVVRTLLTLNHKGVLPKPVQVVAMVRDAARARTRLSDVLDDPALEILEWDLNSLAVPTLGDTNYVVHAASQASPRFYAVDPVGTILPNTVGTASLLATLDPRHARGFLFVSSSEVYGSVAREGSIAEDDYGVVDPTQVRSCYAESKRAGETLCVAWSHQYGIPCKIVRPFHTYGPGLLPDDGRVFSDFAFNMVRSEDIIMRSDGSARRAYCYASDAVSGFFSVLLDGEPGAAYNVANADAELSVLELAEMLVALYPERGLRVVRENLEAGSTYTASTFQRLVPSVDRLEGLGWKAKVGPQEGFRRMIEAYDHTTLREL
jgi:UDP-glucuronate decarboxylase